MVQPNEDEQISYKVACSHEGKRGVRLKPEQGFMYTFQ